MAFLDQYTWRQKNRFLWIGSLAFLGLVYQFSIKPTIRLRQDYRQQQIDRSNAEANAALVQQLRATLDAKTVAYATAVGFAGQKPENEALAQLAAEAEVRVVALPAPSQFSEGGLEVTVTNSRYSGSFRGLLQLLHAVEQHAALQLLNAAFRTENQGPTQEPALFLELNTYTISTPMHHDQ